VKGNILIDIDDQLAEQLNLEAFEEYHRPQQPAVFKGRAFYPLTPESPAGLLVYLVDGSGIKIDSAIIDEEGYFSFKLVQLNQSTTILFEDKVQDDILIDINGVIAKQLDLQSHEKYYKVKQTALVQGHIFYPLPEDIPKGLYVYLVDGIGNILDSALVGSDGSFEIANANLSNTSLKLSQDDENVLVQLVPHIASKFNLKPKDGKYEINGTALFKGRLFYALDIEAPKQIMVYLTGENGIILDSTLTDSNGFFSFDQKYLDERNISLKVNTETAILVDVNTSLAQKLNLIEQGEYYTISDSDLAFEDHVIRGYAYKNLPGDLTKGRTLYLKDSNNELVDVCAINAKGQFGFRKIPNSLPYQIYVPNVGEGVNIIVFDEDNKKVSLVMNEIGNFELPIDRDYTADNFDFLDEKNVRIIVRQKFYDYGRVYFEFDQFKMDAKSQKTLDNIKTILDNNEHIVVNLEGHTDSKGPAAYNQTLSIKRAQSTKNYLIKRGIDASRIKVKGLGETRPASPNQYPDGSDNVEGRKQNRRTEIKISLGNY
ncbi:MAG: OmpA family protein, partial [Flavobacteriales bacterium]|nr:OmpA family protein [Flavobacteriales bacterium]